MSGGGNSFQKLFLAFGEWFEIIRKVLKTSLENLGGLIVGFSGIYGEIKITGGSDNEKAINYRWQ